jgi:hypothetical protein
MTRHGAKIRQLSGERARAQHKETRWSGRVTETGMGGEGWDGVCEINHVK